MFFETLRVTRLFCFAEFPPGLKRIALDFMNVQEDQILNIRDIARGASTLFILTRGERGGSHWQDLRGAFVARSIGFRACRTRCWIQQCLQPPTQSTFFILIRRHVPAPPCTIQYRLESHDTLGRIPTRIVRDWVLPQR